MFRMKPSTKQRVAAYGLGGLASLSAMAGVFLGLDGFTNTGALTSSQTWAYDGNDSGMEIAVKDTVNQVKSITQDGYTEVIFAGLAFAIAAGGAAGAHTLSQRADSMQSYEERNSRGRSRSERAGSSYEPSRP